MNRMTESKLENLHKGLSVSKRINCGFNLYVQVSPKGAKSFIYRKRVGQAAYQRGLGVWPTIAVDTHIFRFGNRTGMAPGKTPDTVEKELLRRVPDKWKKGAHHWMILHGRYVCKARKPTCANCVIADLCLFKAKTL